MEKVVSIHLVIKRFVLLACMPVLSFFPTIDVGLLLLVEMMRHHSPDVYNHTKRDLLPGYDPNEARQIEELQEQYAHFPHNNSEYEFQNMCSDFRVFLEKNYRLPEEDSSDGQESKLAVWFYKILSKRDPYEDIRYRYFDQLLGYLSTFGFEFR